MRFFLSEEQKKSNCDENTASNLAKPGTAEFLAEIEKRRSIKVITAF